jgi:hypothetical protein
MVTAFLIHIRQKGISRVAGIVESTYRCLYFITYARLWEMQQKEKMA